uniref:Uncharacterized protein n=1 Tax=Anopheles albimanus TaxID=7167 RepID=A0A182FA21_ANOAL
MVALWLPALLVSGSVSFAIENSNFSNDCTLRQQSSALYLLEHQPFAICGKVVHLTSFNTAASVAAETSHRLDQECTICCVNRTDSTVRIGIHVCEMQQKHFLFPISFKDLDFLACYSNKAFTLRGTSGSDEWIELTLQPNMGCLRNRAASCRRVFKYEMDDSRTASRYNDSISNHTVPIGLNSSMWFPFAQSRAAPLGCWTHLHHGLLRFFVILLTLATVL